MNDWQQFFDTYADRYDQEIFTKNTEAELPFIVEKLGVPQGGAILDVGCGTGRHSVGLAAAGFRVTGVDLSQGMLDVAKQRALSAGVEVEWVHSNAADFVREGAFDGVICLCEGAMCLLGPGDDPLKRDMVILGNVLRSLKAGGRFLLNVLHASRHFRSHSDKDVAEGRFDVINLTELTDVVQHLGLEGEGLSLRERSYTAPEIRRMLEWTGFGVHWVLGGTAGSWNLEQPKLDEYELMILASKRY